MSESKKKHKSTLSITPVRPEIEPPDDGISVPMTPESTWATLKPGVEQILGQQTMSKEKYIFLYNHVYQYCTCPMYIMKADSSLASPTSPPSSTNCNVELLGEQLYLNLYRHLGNYVKNLMIAGRGKHNEEVLAYYSEKWTVFTFSAKVMHHVFMYLNKHWVRRVVEDGRKNFYEIYNLCLLLWREVLMSELQKVVTAAVMLLIERERLGDIINTQFIILVHKSYVELGVDITPHHHLILQRNKAAQNARKLFYYKEYLEKVLIEETINFYKKESYDFLRDNPVAEYVKKAEGRLAEEKARVERYLHESTMSTLIHVCEDALIEQHLTTLCDDFKLMLHQNKNDDMQRMYVLVQRTKTGLDKMRDIVEAHIKREGEGAIESCGEVLSNEPQKYVDSILQVHTKYYRLVVTAFNSDSRFMAALDKACKAFINENSVTKQPKCSNKSPELLASYCHQLLKKSSKMAEEAELEDILVQVMIVFKYLNTTDVFETYYRKYLAKRLVEHMSISDDAEGSMITKLKETCGNLYTDKIQKMFLDVDLNKSLNDRFKEYSKNLGPEAVLVDFYIDVLTHGSWPFYTQETFGLPKELESCIHTFTNFYFVQYSGRKLTWLYDKSRGDIHTLGFKKKFILTASTYQIAVLMQYNHAHRYSFEQLKDNTQIEESKLQQVLKIFVKTRLLFCQDDKSEGDNDDQLYLPTTMFDLFEDYYNKKLRVNINVPLKSEVKMDQEQTEKSIDEERKFIMEAVIVRIMKMRQTMKHNELTLAVIEQLKSRFIPSNADIKRVIGSLIEREYMSRLEAQSDTYVYKA